MKYLGRITDNKDLVTKEYVDNAVAGGGGGGGDPTAYTVQLTAAGWSNGAQTVTARGVTANNVVIVSPAPSSLEDYFAADVKCVAQAANALTFECDTVPETALAVNIIVFAAEYSMFYTGASAPAASLGSEGDIYLKE